MLLYFFSIKYLLLINFKVDKVGMGFCLEVYQVCNFLLKGLKTTHLWLAYFSARWRNDLLAHPRNSSSWKCRPISLLEWYYVLEMPFGWWGNNIWGAFVRSDAKHCNTHVAVYEEKLMNHFRFFSALELRLLHQPRLCQRHFWCVQIRGSLFTVYTVLLYMKLQTFQDRNVIRYTHDVQKVQNTR